MEDERGFENCFADFDVNGKFMEYKEDTNEIDSLWRDKLSSFINHQLNTIEKYDGKGSKVDTSVYTGISGVSLLYVLLSETFEKDADKYIKKALSLIKPYLESTTGHRLSFLCGDAGILAIGTIIYHKLDLFQERDRLLKRLIDFTEEIINFELDFPDEILYGRAGYLFALLFVKKYIVENLFNLQESIKEVIAAILVSGQKLSKKEKWKCPLMYKWHDKHYFGGAHGLAGILYMLLQVPEMLSEEEKNKLIKPTIDYLMTLKYPSGNYPSSHGNRSDKLVQWCHGSPGFIHLFIEAFKVFDEEMYLNEAVSCSNVIWNRGLVKKGYGICHGISGNAMAFLQIFRITSERKYLYRATKFAEFCFDIESRKCRTPDRPLSLFEGLSGTVWFMISMLNPENAKFPAFQVV